MAMRPAYGVMLGARLSCGFGVGGVTPLLFAYLVDVLPEKWRGPSSLGMAASGGATAFSVLFIIRSSTAIGPDGWRIAIWGFTTLALACAFAFWLSIEPGAAVAEREAGAAQAARSQSELGLWSHFRRPL